jgi:hypothetical protein
VADILIDNQTAPTTPASGKSVLWIDSTTKYLVQTNDTGRHTGDFSRNDATASQGAGFATDTYVTNSGLLIPSFGMKAGQLYRWWISLSKTAAGTTAAAVTVRIGTGQATSDTARLTLTQGVAQAANAVSALLIVFVGVRNVGASGVIAGGFGFTQSYGTTAGTQGFGNGADGVSSTFDNSALAGNYVGLSINGGTSAAWTISHVAAELIG